jgi:hypothetical protein
VLQDLRLLSYLVVYSIGRQACNRRSDSIISTVSSKVYLRVAISKVPGRWEIATDSETWVKMVRCLNGLRLESFGFVGWVQ